MDNPLIERLTRSYRNFNSELIQGLEYIYGADILFQDPFRKVKGLAQLTAYYEDMLQGLTECRFEYDQLLKSESCEKKHNEVVLFWTMYLQHPKLAGAKTIVVPGNSHLKFSDKVFYHRDYYDAGAMIYEHVPLLGFGVRRIKKRLEG